MLVLRSALELMDTFFGVLGFRSAVFLMANVFVLVISAFLGRRLPVNFVSAEINEENFMVLMGEDGIVFFKKFLILRELRL